MEDMQVDLDEVNLKFKIVIGEKEAFITYMLAGTNRIVFTHTEVPPELEGQGLANLLAGYVLKYAKENELVVIPLCPFVALYIRRHPEYSSLVLPGYRY